MNTSRLAKHYSSLSVMERLRLIQDAGRRGDATEQQRLRDASPRQHYSMLDTGRLENNLRTSWLVNTSFQLATASEFWLAKTHLLWGLEGVTDDDPSSDLVREWSCIAILAEATYAISRDGWRLFIKQSGFDESRIMINPLADHWMIEYMDEHASVPSELETAVQWLDSRTDQLGDKSTRPFTIITPESIAEAWHRAIKDLSAL